MHVALDDPRLVPDLVEFLGRARVAAKAGRSGRILLGLPTSAEERTRLELIVTGWEAMHPTAGVTFVDSKAQPRFRRRPRSPNTV